MSVYETDSEKIVNAINKYNIFSCDENESFQKYIVYKFPINSYSGSVFILIDVDNTFIFVKICFYKKTLTELYIGKKDITTTHQNDAEIKILNILNEKITHKYISPCIINLIYTKKCNNLSKIYPTDKLCTTIEKRAKLTHKQAISAILCGMKDLIKHNIYNSEFSFLVLELCDLTMDSFIIEQIKNPELNNIIKSILFQIIYTFYRIKKIYPKFSHNDTHLHNIMIKIDHKFKYTKKNQKYIVYNDEKTSYAVPFYGFIPKIIDFGFASLPEENIFNDIKNNRELNYLISPNDMLFLFNDIYKATNYDYNVIKFLNILDPTKAYKKYSISRINELEKNNKIQSEHKMLNSAVYKAYKQFKPAPGQIYKIYN